MTYTFVQIVRFIIALLLASMFVCLSAFDSTIPLWADLFIRLGGGLIMFVLGCGVGCHNEKEKNDG